MSVPPEIKLAHHPTEHYFLFSHLACYDWVMYRALLIGVILFSRFASAVPPSTQPTTQTLEQQLAQHKEHERQDYLKQIMESAELKLPHSAVSDIFELSIDNGGMLAVAPKVGATDGQMRCKINGLAGPAVVSVFADRNSPAAAINGLQFAHRDFSNDPEIFRHTMLFAQANSIQLSMDLDGLIQSKDVSLIENLKSDDPDSAVQLIAQVFDAAADGTIGDYKVSAPNFRELRQRYPRETQEFVVPILRDLQCEHILSPDARIAYQVFQTDFKPDAELTRKIDAALAKFDSDNFQEREQAARDLDALGESAAMVLVKADRKGWSIDRGNGVDTFLSQHKALPTDQLNKLNSDPIFLLDCLYSTDIQIRTSAMRSLEPIVKQKIQLGESDQQNDETIDRVYRKLFKPLSTKPVTTQP